MQIERWTITNHAEWLERRRRNINGSEVGGLFGCSPYVTPYALYADKAGLAEISAPDSDVLKRGRILEPAIAAAVAEERPGWKIQKATDYLWSPDARLGCTPDFDVHCPERGMGVLQGKTVAKPKFDEEWQDGPPLWMVLQTHQEMMLSGVRWAAIGVLITSTFTIDCRIYEFERHEGAEARIFNAAGKFWHDLAVGRAPEPDWCRDDTIVKLMYPQDNGVTIDLTTDNRMPELLADFERLSAEGNKAEAALKAVKAEIAAKLGDAAAARLPGWEVTHKTQERKGYVVQPTTFRVLRVKRTEQGRAAA
jgi:predicted phage-related endonuclease